MIKENYNYFKKKINFIDSLFCFSFKGYSLVQIGMTKFFKILNKYRLEHIMYRTICITGLFRHK